MKPELAHKMAQEWVEADGRSAEALRDAAERLLPDTEDWALFPPDRIFAIAGNGLYQLAVFPEGIAVDRWIIDDGRTRMGVLEGPETRTWRFVRTGGHDLEITVVSPNVGAPQRRERFARAVARAAGWPLPD